MVTACFSFDSQYLSLAPLACSHVRVYNLGIENGTWTGFKYLWITKARNQPDIMKEHLTIELKLTYSILDDGKSYHIQIIKSDGRRLFNIDRHWSSNIVHSFSCIDLHVNRRLMCFPFARIRQMVRTPSVKTCRHSPQRLEDMWHRAKWVD
jgi:hypothetical protein